MKKLFRWIETKRNIGNPYCDSCGSVLYDSDEIAVQKKNDPLPDKCPKCNAKMNTVLLKT